MNMLRIWGGGIYEMDAFYEMCDKYGILVMDENRNFNSSADGIKQVQDMVMRDRNHPSVVMYSLFNEEPLQALRQAESLPKDFNAK